MKTLKLALVSAMIAITSSAFAGNIETCTSCEMTKNETASLLKADSAALTDSRVKGVLQNMTLRVREKLNTENISTILQNMTQSVRKKVNSNSAENSF